MGKFKYKVGVIGYGNMAGCIIGGAICRNVLQKDKIAIYDIDKEKTGVLGFCAAESIQEICLSCEYILISVKPQHFPEVLSKMQNHENVFITIMAGVPTSVIGNCLKTDKIARCMPNTPCLIGEGAMGLFLGNLNGMQRDFIRNLFLSCGQVLEIAEEKINAVTAVSGSGPAYFYAFIKAVVETGVKLGLEFDTAKQLALQTAIGAAEMIRRADCDIDTLIERVCSKGGTTIQAVDFLKENNLSGLVEEAMMRCYQKAEQMERGN